MQLDPGNPWVHLRKLRSKGNQLNECRTQIQLLASRFGDIEFLKLLVGRGQAILRMSESESALKLIKHFESGENSRDENLNLLKNAMASQGNTPKTDIAKVPNEDTIKLEVNRCINKLLCCIISRYSEERNIFKKELNKRKHSELATSMTRSESYKQSSRVCYEYTTRGGKCSMGDECRLLHRIVSIADIPKKYRAFETLNQFPLPREISPIKEEVNNLLRNLTSTVSNKRCLVLDGSSSNTAKELIRCDVHKRTKEHIIIPNYCFETYEKIKNLGDHSESIIYDVFKI